jgi:hypothetical protein
MEGAGGSGAHGVRAHVCLGTIDPAQGTRQRREDDDCPQVLWRGYFQDLPYAWLQHQDHRVSRVTTAHACVTLQYEIEHLGRGWATVTAVVLEELLRGHGRPHLGRRLGGHSAAARL